MRKERKVIGWREWVELPELNLTIKAKIDTGARTSALHAFYLRPFVENGKQRIAFDIHPEQRNQSIITTCVADVLDKRWVCDSGGHREERYVILTPLKFAGKLWPIEITLTERDNMLFRMLLGRSAIKRKFVVDTSLSFTQLKQEGLE